MAYIYKITNDLNNKVYIGQTSFDVNQRLKKHFIDARRSRMEHRPLYSAINKYGEEHFHIEIVEETNNPLEREQYWIQYYNSYHYGYNATLGGEGKSFYNHDEIYNLFMQGKTVKEICTRLGCCKKTCTEVLKAKGVPASELVTKDLNKAQNEYSKPIAKLDIKTENIVAVYPSIMEGAKSIKNNPKDITHVSEVCRGKRKTAYGYKWKFITKEEYEMMK